MKTVHEKIKNHPCNQCEKAFAEKHALREHVKNVHEKLKYKCDFKNCEKSYGVLAELREHKDEVHQEDERNYKCKYCGKPYNVKRYVLIKRSLKIVVLIHAVTNRVLSPFYFLYRQMMEHISRVHEGIKFDCEICQKSFKHKQYLKLHQKTVHEGIKEHFCEEPGCGKNYPTALLLKNHIDSFHKGKKRTLEK